MKKSEAIRLFDTGAALARAVGLTRGRISQWPDELTQKQADLVRGAAVRLGKMQADDGVPAPGTAFGEFGEPRSGIERREGDRRQLDDPDFGDFGEPRDGERRVEDRRQSAPVDESV